METKSNSKSKFVLTGFDFGKTSGFNPGCDLNNDGWADITDIIAIAKNFGWR